MGGSCGCTPISRIIVTAVCKVLSCAPEREQVQAALMQWDGEAFETAAYAAGGVVAMMRSHDEWSASPHGKALAELPVLSIEKIGDAAPKPWPSGDRPLAGLRVLDLSRVIAGPVAGRTLGRARRRRDADFRSRSACDPVADDRHRPRQADQFCRSQAASRVAACCAICSRRRIFFRRAIARARSPGSDFRLTKQPRINPGIVYVSLSAYGHAGPWAERRGFDSLVQTSTGFNHAEGQAMGVEGPKELPAQMLDHASGYLMAFGAMMARARQAREGGSWHVRVSLAQTGRWLWNLGRLDDGPKAPDYDKETVEALIEDLPSGFGPLRSVRHAARAVENPGASGLVRRCRSAVIRRNGPGNPDTSLTAEPANAVRCVILTKSEAAIGVFSLFETPNGHY